ncbi:MAG TPA: PIG-L deacetylase family protein [Blastocatellia bacterium]|nr:PIG-L deacetylase family protein [Blastocatellia bacterium]
MNTLLAIFAHPDDESLVAGGTLARYAAEGWRTALICATRGEWGPISDESLADYENLGERRERELREACAVLGVSWLQFLDLEDGAVAAPDADEEVAALEKLARSIRELRPQIIITFGPDGLYGHADHIAIGQLATRARAIAGDPNAFPRHLDENLAPHHAPRLLYATAPQGLYPNLIARLAEAGHETHLWGIPPEQFGVPPQEITTTFDVTPFLDRKLAAMRRHRTQLDDSHAFTHLTPELAVEFFGSEFFRRGGAAADHVQKDCR